MHENASARVQNFKIFLGSMPPHPPRVEGPLGLRQIYPPVTLKYPLVQKLIETPVSSVIYQSSWLFIQLHLCNYPMCLLSLHFELVVSSLSVHKIHQQTASWLHPQLSCLPWNSASCKKSKKHFTFSHCPSPIYFVKASLFFLHFFFSKVSVYILLYVAYKCGMT